ncbi:HCP-like protein [Dioscorea alata]|uniref:HCP-like protein n=1 Tax=Dioscorea alata TaxID=55571 RepID=A0ACB7UV45_DIOAL|nr:HCP-like protein [Dioscorea alata]
MAIWSSDWPLPPLPPRKTLFKTSLFISISPTPSINPFATRKSIFTNSSKPSSSPPLLDNTPNGLQLIQLPPISDLQITTDFIHGLCQNSTTESIAFDYYQKAKQQPQFKPLTQTMNLLIKTLLKSKQWSSISTLVHDFKVFSVFPGRLTYSRLITSCIVSRKFKLTESLLSIVEAKEEIAVSAFSSAMRSYNKLHMYSSTVMISKRMKSSGIAVTPRGYLYIMKAHHMLGNPQMVLSLFNEFEAKNWKFPELTAKIYAVLCDSLGKSGNASEALRYFRDMLSKGIPPNHSLYASLISSFAVIREAEMAESLFQEAKNKAMVKDLAVFLKLVVMHVDAGLEEKAVGVVEAMVEMKIWVTDCILCAIVNGYNRRRGLKASVMVYERLISLGCEPGQVTYASMISIYWRLGLPLKAEALFLEMMEKGFNRCLVAYSTMISMYGKLGRASDAMKLLAKMKEIGCKPNVWVYNALLDMHGRLVNLRQVEKLWKEMKRRKIQADKFSYTSIIGAYNKAGEFEECIKYYHEFKMNGGKLDRALCGIMAAVFSKSERIDELLKLLQEMKTEGVMFDERLYKSALNALRDAALHLQVEWFQKNVSFHKDET